MVNENQIIDNPIIVSAANRYGSLIISAPRHWDDVMQNIIEAMGGIEYILEEYGNETQGFVDQFGKFYDRHEAMKIAIMNNQAPKFLEGTILTSEDLY